MVYARTPVINVNLDLATKLFECYVMPILQFNSIIWTTNYASSLDEKLDTVLMSYYKRYCGLHPKTRNSLVYYLTGMSPLSDRLQAFAMTQKENIKSNYNLNIENFLLITDRRAERDPYQLYENIPTEFWLHKPYEQLPSRFSYRKDLCNKIVDGHHKRKCKRLVDNPKDFHLESDISCICKYCNRHLEWYHECTTIDA